MENGKEILLVDDDNDMTELYEMSLTPGEYDWKIFGNGFEALDYLQRNDGVVAVILDMAMPTLDGLEIAEQIRRNEELHPYRQPVRLAFLTAFNETDAAIRIADKANVEMHWTKPMDSYELKERVAEWLK